MILKILKKRLDKRSTLKENRSQFSGWMIILSNGKVRNTDFTAMTNKLTRSVTLRNGQKYKGLKHVMDKYADLKLPISGAGRKKRNVTKIFLCNG